MIDALDGVTVTVFTVPLTVMTAVPVFVGSALDVAVIVAVPKPVAVTTPVVFIVAIAALLETHVTPVDIPASATTLAESPRVAPTARVAVDGVTVTLVTTPVTVTLAVAFLVGSECDVAVMVVVPTPTPATDPPPTVAIAAFPVDQSTV
jgi:hypothetical protein